MSVFFELDGEFYCERAIYKTENELINTYLTIEKPPYFLPEGSLKDSLEFMNLSSKKEFESLYEESTKESESEWNKLTYKYNCSKQLLKVAEEKAEYRRTIKERAL